MTAIDELCALGFEKYWVNQALELTNHNQEYALEWLLSDEFKLAKEQFDRAKREFQKKQTPHGIARPETSTKKGSSYNNNDNPLLDSHHNKEPSLQEMPNLHQKSNQKSQSQSPSQQEVDFEYDPNGPDWKPKATLTDFKKVGIDHLLDNNSDSESGGSAPDNKHKKKKDDADADIEALIQGPKELKSEMSSPLEHDPEQQDEEMQGFLLKLKNQVNIPYIPIPVTSQIRII